MRLYRLRKKIIIFFIEKLPSPYFYSNRAKIIFICFGLGFCLLLSRGLWLHLFSASDILNSIARQQYQSSIKLSPYRGTIYDRRYVPLAISIKTPSLAINPKLFNPTEAEETQLSQILKIKIEKIRDTENRKNYFAWLKRKISSDAFEQIKTLDITGLYSIMEPSRFYPQGYHAAHLIGLVGTDDNGLLGLERVYDKKLKAPPGESLRLRDAKGHQILLNADSALPQTAGYNLILTIDTVIQEITEKSLEKWVAEAKAKSGFAIVADPHTGRILALANQPSFDPNEPQRMNIQNTNNAAFTDLFEPGSIMKSFVLSTAIEQKLTTENEIFNCEKGKYQVDEHNYIHDDHPKDLLTTSEILIHSSNIGTYKIAKRMGKKGLWNALRNFGFGLQEPLIEFPGARGGELMKPEKWEAIRFANIAFGQGLLVTGLEVVGAYSVFANGGNLVKPQVIERIENEEGHILYAAELINKKKILSPKTVGIIRNMLERVVNEGGGTLAKTPLYTTAGKTGTAQKNDPQTHRYGPNMRIANFVGFSPVSDPHIIVYIVIDEPQKKPYYGGTWAAPAFSEIVLKTLKYLNVAPDKIPVGELKTKTLSEGESQQRAHRVIE
jgi:cell division protein FtsI (penicillin-binding protein 3)